MGKKKSSFHIGNEFNGYGNVRYLKAELNGIHPEVTQKNIRPAANFTSCILKATGANPVAIDPQNITTFFQAAIGSIPSTNRVTFTKTSGSDTTVVPPFPGESSNSATINQDVAEIIVNPVVTNPNPTNGSYNTNAGTGTDQTVVPPPVGMWEWDANVLKWKYYEDGYAFSRWVYYKNLWYYIGSDYYMVTGWKNIDSKWYYFTSEFDVGKQKELKGYMLTGWRLINNEWYYLVSKKEKDAGTGDEVEKAGHMATGWREIKGKWYFFYTKETGSPEGAMAYNKIIDWKGKKYFVKDKSDGSMAVNEEITDPETGTRYRADADGVLTEVDILADKNIYTNYDITLEEALAAQMKQKPQVSSGGKWINASREQVLKYLDPNNYIEEPYNYQFLDLSVMAGISEDEMKKFLSGKGVLSGKESIYLSAAQNYNVSEVYLAAHSALETGNGTSVLAKGVVVNGVTVYNMYGIGAYDKSAVDSGSKFAASMGWDSVEKAIDGGAKWISGQYINHPTYNQNTLYKMRWNPAAPGKHQYATDIGWAVKQTSNIKKMYDNFPNATKVFDIPVYKVGGN